MTVIGAVALPSLPPERLAGVAAAADSAGLEELWLWEDCFWAGGVAAAAVALGATRRLRVGIGVLPVPLRASPLLAMELAALARTAPARLVPAVGHGVQDWMGQVGARVASPLTLLREYTKALQALFAGEEVSTPDNRYVRLDRIRLAWPPTAPLPVHIGTEGPRSLALAGELADGTILTGGTTPDGVRAAREHIERGRRAAAEPRPHRLTVYVRAATGHDAEQRLAADAARWGLDPSDGDNGVAGDAETIAAAVQRWADAGADVVVLQPTADDPDPEGFVRFAGAEVAPLLPPTP